MRIARCIFVVPPAYVLHLIGYLPRCGYLQLLAAAMLGKGNIR